MRTLCCFLTLFILAGCAGPDHRPGGSRRKDPASLSALDQYKAAQNAFQEKLDAATGLTLAELKTQWGQVRQGFTHNQSTIYHWVRNITVVPPPEAAAKLGLGGPADGNAVGKPRALSCMAVFIVNQDVVDEASSEGPGCLDQTLMPGWQPSI